MKFRVVHEVNVPADKYWQYLMDPELEAAVAKALNLAVWQVYDAGDQGGRFVRKVHVVPDVVLPGPLKKLVGESIGYTQTDMVPKTGTQYEWTAVPDALADKASMTGTFAIEPAGEGRARRTIAGEVNVKIFAIGGMVEKFVVDELEKNYLKAAREQERWIRAKLGNA